MIARRFLLAIATPLAMVACAAPAAAAVINVVKTASCGCCAKWVDHLRKAGHDVRVTDVADVGPTAKRLGVPDDLRSCHSASVGKYALEGHVPAADIARLLKEKPKDTKALRKFIDAHRNKDGGYATKPGDPSSMSGV